MTNQAIPTGLWTKLDGYDVEAIHHAGHNVCVRVQQGNLTTDDPNAEMLLRPSPGTFTTPWKAPISGRYAIGGDLPGPEGTTHRISFEATLDDRHIVTEAGPGLSVAMNSGSPLET